ncbi:MAG: GNAT family N-acetyltransferase [Candidatus Aenigmatarchaeota archaeon]
MKKKPEILIRKATLKDVPRLVEMWEDLIKYHKNLPVKINIYKDMKKNAADVWRKYAKKMIRGKDSSIYVAEINEKLVGYSVLMIKKDPPVYKNEKIGYFSDAFVDKHFRGMGISSLLKDVAILWFRKKGLKYASLVVDPKNKHAHNIYKKWGFSDLHIVMRRKV